MAYEDRMADYATVAERIVEFREKYPDGSLRPLNPAQPYQVITLEHVAISEDGEVTNVRQSFVVYAAAAFRTPDDPAPGVGCAWEPYPGRTPYTRTSELMNAETSAWGRAIVAALIADARKSVSSAEEVRNRNAERDTGVVRTDPANERSVAAEDIVVRANEAAPSVEDGAIDAARLRRFQASLLQLKAEAMEKGLLTVRRDGTTLGAWFDRMMASVEQGIKAREEPEEPDGAA